MMLGEYSDSLSEGVMVARKSKKKNQYDKIPKKEPVEMKEPKLPDPSEISSQCELLKFVFATDPEIANTIIDIHVGKHPAAIQMQAALFTSQPGIFSTFVHAIVDSTHPLRAYNEFQQIRYLLDKNYPTLSNTFDEVQVWARQLELALVRFLHCALSIDDDPARIVKGSEEGSTGISPVLYSPEHVDTFRAMKPPLQIYRVGIDVTNISGVMVHGHVQEHQQRFIVEIAAAHKYFMARKIAILKSLEGNSKLTVGVYNVMTIVKESPFMSIGYRINDEDSYNIPEEGIDFNDLVPVICLDRNCRQGRHCTGTTREYKFIYIKVSSVHLGNPPLAAKNTVNFDGMENAWGAMEDEPKPADVLSPYSDTETKKKARRKDADYIYRKTFSDRYLRALIQQYQEKNKEDVKMIAQNMIPTTPAEDYSDLNLRLEGDFNNAFPLFMPIVFSKL